MQIEQLVDALQPLLREPTAEGDFAYGLAAFPAAGTDVMVNVDPELEDRDDVEVAGLVDRVATFLALSPAQWETVVAEVVAEVEEAAGEVTVPVALQDDLGLTSVVVFLDAVLLTFVAPLQLPDCTLRVQLDEDLSVEDLAVELDGVENPTFDDADDLLDRLAADRSPDDGGSSVS